MTVDRDVPASEPAAGDPPTRTVEVRSPASYMLRTAQQAHAHISSLADQKVNILITVSSIILTLAFTRLHDERYRWALLTLVVFTLSALVLAVLAILPRFTKQDVSGPLPRGFNLLFFGHFALLSEDRYMEEMREVIRDDTRIYEAQIRDLYQVGSYLHLRKFRYLRASYLLLITGFVTASAVHVLAGLIR